MRRSHWTEIPTTNNGTILLNLDQVVSVRPGTDAAIFLLADGQEQECALTFAAARKMLLEPETPAGTFG